MVNLAEIIFKRLTVSKSILVIDDSITNLVLLEAVMEEEGYKTILATGVTEGLKIMRSQMPALVLLDLLMPKNSGIDFLEAIANDKQIKDIPVFVITAAVQEEYQHKVIELGAKEFFTKPIDLKKLITRVKTII
ncbi:two-component system, OmpR family, alkaline phosphatase synthesis response regulator PhoP [Williamwhitmania taraxaci]|uniref:Two-component system, OmpR family, alkaline phosphatase synthesis response regulator PhoP n=1 Tax=Williamwhitmania taraxaci TaxID=1640674 RepID=A0A1G6Q1K9_9BACT|nr:two-component system, OmpR family, alkaline phosphatase synthesis response regulator PhoP [Williamwhitmania taraxaci]